MLITAQILEEGLKRLGWEGPTPIQRKAFPVLLHRRDALLIAPTGSGKTEAVMLPILALLKVEGDREAGIKCLYITPLRSLNRDILRRLLEYAGRLGLRAEVRHGDTPEAMRRRMAQQPPDILITTPETLAIILCTPSMRRHLRSLEWIIVDELHELMGSKRGAHLTLSLERLEELSLKRPIRVGLSATIGRPDLAAKFLVGEGRSCAILLDPSHRSYSLGCEYVKGSQMELADGLLRLLEGIEGSSLVFTNTRDGAERLGSLLMARGYERLSLQLHHGSLSREVREEVEGRLRVGEREVVICTSSLELGLDIGRVDFVVQIDSPRQATKLAQRIGRSRHRVGEEARGLILTNRIDDELEGIVLVDRLKRGELELISIHEGALDILAHHLAGLALEKGTYLVEEALFFRRAYPFRSLQLEDLHECLVLMKELGLLHYDGKRVSKRPATYEYYFDNASTIPDALQYEVRDLVSGRRIGNLDQLFVAEYGEPGRCFVLKGMGWRIEGVEQEKGLIFVVPHPIDLSTIPHWMGELIPVDYETAQRVGRLRRRIASGERGLASDEAYSYLKDTKEALGLVPDERVLVLEVKRDGRLAVLHACLGSKANQTLATIIATLLTSRLGQGVEARSDPYRVLLRSEGGLRGDIILQVLRGDFNPLEVLLASLHGSHPLNWRIWQVARRFGMVKRRANYDGKIVRLIRERYGLGPIYREAVRELLHDKFELERVKEILEQIRAGLLRVRVVEVESPSPMAQQILEHPTGFSITQLSRDAAVLGLVKERIAKVKHRLVCLSCGEWESVISTNEAAERIRCPVCTSRLIGWTHPSDDALIKIAKKRRRGKGLSGEEEKAYRRAWKAASLINQFGKKALLVLSGFGVGVDTAARILRQHHDGEEELYQLIHAAERQYVSTRGFWRD